jgi:hypothetical protein
VAKFPKTRNTTASTQEFQLVRNDKVIFRSKRKLDAIYEHQKYRRNQHVNFQEATV